MSFFKNKKAVVGIGVLIVFIAGILVASVSAGVLLRTQSVLQNQALQTGAAARDSISTNLNLQAVTGSNGQDGSIEDMTSLLKLGTSSDAVSLNKTLIVIAGSNISIALKYGGVGEDIHFTNQLSREIKWDINNSPTRLKTDFDVDYIEDYVYVYNSTLLIFNLSSESDFNVSIINISSPGTVISNTYPLIGDRNYGSITISGTTTTSDVLDKDLNIFINPIDNIVGYGLYSIKYPIKGKSHVIDAFSYGDVIKFYTELSQPVPEMSRIEISYYTHIGIALTKSFSTPASMTTEKVRLFP